MMAVFVQNANQSLCISLTVLKLVGFWPPRYLSGHKYILYKLYFCLTFMFFLGTFLVVQTVDLFMIWGDIPLMTGTAFVLFTNLAQAAKILTIFFRRKTIETIIDHADEALRAEENQEAKKIVRECDLETKCQQIFYICLTTVTVVGWASSAESNQLPLRAWYPYDTTKSPAYEISYFHQIGALFIAAYLNVSKDTLVTTLIAQCRCQLTLLGLSLRTLSQDLKIQNKSLLSPDEEQIIKVRLRRCIERHQSALEAGVHLQTCFSAPVFAQFTVSLVIICVTAFQLTSQTGNHVRLLSMGTYLFNMMFQVFLYCYQGDKLTEESTKVANAVYQTQWYTFPVPVKRSILILMTRCHHVARLTAGGFTTLSLTSFMAIMKASYSFFTVLQQVNENNN